MMSPPVFRTSLRHLYVSGEDSIAALDADDDAEVVRAVLAGDVERYAILVRRYRERFASYAARVAGSADAAEDAMQEAFIRAFDRLGQCRERENFGGWFFMILRNCCFAEARARRRRQDLYRPTDGSALVEPTRADGPMEEAERRRVLRRALAKLTPVQREVFALKHLEGMSYEDIARQLATSVASLKMRMHRAYDRLRAELEDHR